MPPVGTTKASDMRQKIFQRKFFKSNKEAARSTEFHDLTFSERMSADSLLAFAESSIARAGYTFTTKRSRAVAAKMTTTDPVTKTIWLAYGWDQKSIAERALVLIHELVHVRQAEAWGARKFLRRYLMARWRWIIEMQAYTVSMKATRALGLSTDGKAKRIGKSIHKNYGPWVLFSKSEVVNSTVEILEGA